MKYKITIEDIYNRLHLPVNKDKYHNLINHTSAVRGGNEFLKTYDRADELCKKKELAETEIVELECLIQKLTKWIEDNNW